jgi:hypothetical protein
MIFFLLWVWYWGFELKASQVGKLSTASWPSPQPQSLVLKQETHWEGQLRPCCGWTWTWMEFWLFSMPSCPGTLCPCEQAGHAGSPAEIRNVDAVMIVQRSEWKASWRQTSPLGCWLWVFNASFMVQCF